MRLLSIFLLCGLLGATPMVEDQATAPDIQSLAAAARYGTADQIPETVVPAPPVADPEDVVALTEDNLLETAFLAHFPDHVTLATFRSAASGSLRIQQTDVLDRLPLNTATGLLTAGSGIFFVFVLGIGLVERLRLAYEAP